MAIIKKSIDRSFTHTRRFLGIQPIIQFFLEKLGVARIIDSHIQQDSRSQLSVGKTVGVLIHNILSSPMPMYEIADWSSIINEDSLGLEAHELSCICDDRIGRALDTFYKGKHKEVFFHREDDIESRVEQIERILGIKPAKNIK